MRRELNIKKETLKKACTNTHTHTQSIEVLIVQCTVVAAGMKADWFTWRERECTHSRRETFLAKLCT